MVRLHGGAAFAAKTFLLGSAAFALMGAASLPSASIEPRLTTAVEQPAIERPVTDIPVIAAPIALWSVDNAQTLVRTIEGAGAEGLRPEDYRLGALRAAIARGPSPMLDSAAQASALALAHDYFLGRVTDQASMDWHIARPEGDAMLPGALRDAVATGQIGKFFQSLLPGNARYRALRTALADADDGATRDRIRANMERWRWMPRNMGQDMIYVNVPSYQLQLINDGQVQSVYTVVVGAKDTPTPLLASTAPSMVVNPWWNVPESIVRKSNLRAGQRGFVYRAGGSGIAQPPGPHNALGKLKINLTDTPAIYLHDTDAKAGFGREARALSHGCVRVKDVDQLAGELMRDGGDEARFEAAYAGTETATVHLPKPWTVYLVYFTMDQDRDGQLTIYGDPYGRDAQVLAKLDGAPIRANMRIASN